MNYIPFKYVMPYLSALGENAHPNYHWARIQYPAVFCFKNTHLGFPRECGQPSSKIRAGMAATPTHLPCFSAGKRQPRNSYKVRMKIILSSLHEAISSVQPFVLKDKLIDKPIFYCCAPPRTPLMITQHFQCIRRAWRAALGKAVLEEEKVPCNKTQALHSVSGWAGVWRRPGSLLLTGNEEGHMFWCLSRPSPDTLPVLHKRTR